MEFSTAGRMAWLHTVGELDAVATPELRPSIDALLAERHLRVVVDVSGLRLIDSRGGADPGGPGWLLISWPPSP